MRRLSPFAFLLISLLAAPALRAEEATAPAAGESFGAWQLGCAAGSCQLQQSARAGESEPPAFLMVIAPGPDGRADYAVMTVPLGVYLAPGIELHIDRQRPFVARFEICEAKGCLASFRLDGAVLEAMRKGREARARVWLARDRAVDFPLSLSGFTAAHRAYRERGGR